MGKLVYDVGRIDTLGEDDDDWNVRPRVFEDFRNLCRFGSDEFRVFEDLNDVVPYSEIDSVRSEAPEDDHFANRIIAFGFPLTWKLSFLWLGLL